MPDKQPQKYTLFRRNRTSLIERPQSEARETRRSTFIGAGKTVADVLGAGIKRPRKRKSSDKLQTIDSSSDSDQENTPKKPPLQFEYHRKKRNTLSQMSPQSQVSDTSSFDLIASTPVFDNGKEIGPEADPSTTWTLGKFSLSKNFNKADVMSSDSDDN